MKKKQVSLKDIANEVGVSIATVSYVLSDRKDSRVSQAMAKKIKEVAKTLNYQPNKIAQSLKSGKTNTIGLIVADISNPFFANIARIIEDEATNLNYTVIFGSSDEKAEKSLHLIDFLSSRQVDGFIIVPSEGSDNQIIQLKQQNIPLVLIDRYFPNISTNYVVIDNFEASSKVIKELIVSGYERIGMIAYSNPLFHMRERIRGYKETIQNHFDNRVSSNLVEIDFNDSENQIRTGIDSLLARENPIEAIFFATNTLAILGLKYIDELSLRVPNDIAIVSFDEGEAFDFYYCPLTHIRQPLDEIGKKAVQVLTQQIAQPDIGEKQICLEADLIKGKSSLKL